MKCSKEKKTIRTGLSRLTEESAPIEKLLLGQKLMNEACIVFGDAVREFGEVNEKVADIDCETVSELSSEYDKLIEKWLGRAMYLRFCQNG